MFLESQVSPYAGRRVLVLGAAGFIGRWVARAFSNHQAHLYLVVHDYAKALEIFERYEIKGTPIQADLANTEIVRNLIKTIRPDITFNLAGYGIDRRERNEKTAYQINAYLILTLCQALCSSPSSWRGQTLVHAGSALEYGSIGGNLAEDSIPHPTTLYGRSKLAGTQMLLQCCQTYGVRGISARLFTVYGPGEHESRLSPTLIHSAKTTEPIHLTKGNQKRDFTYVEDVAEGLLRLGLVPTEFGQVVNLATGQLTSVQSFVETAASILKISSERLNFGVLPPLDGEMHHAPVSIVKLVQFTQWMPKTTITQGIYKTIAFLEQS